ncbi:MAG: ornithine carbamoyltransferase [Clostridiales bacterium]|nr:ornithine carbamoyltransferase [Clostridiales bacterium]
MEHLLKLLDLTPEEIFAVLDRADQMKYDLKHHRVQPVLQGKSLIMVFAKPSTRTRVSFETGMFQLGGQAIHLNQTESQMARGEAVEDTARVLGRYCDGIMIRTYDQQEVEQLAQAAGVPVINGLTDFAHPCQVLADLMTIREHKTVLSGVRLGYVGDGANVCNSLIVGGLKAGLQVTVACPAGCEPSPRVLEFAAAYPERFTLSTDPRAAAEGADVLVTDSWSSMGRARDVDPLQRQAIFQPYQLNDALLALAAPDCLVQHCLPAQKGQEITRAVFERHAGQIFDEAENRLHVQKAILAMLME